MKGLAQQFFFALFFISLYDFSFSQNNPVLKQWDYRFGGLGNEQLGQFHQLQDNSFILGGSSKSGIGGDKTQPNWDSTLTTNDYWIAKIDSFGTIQWDKRYGGRDNDNLTLLRQTADGGYILGGSSESDSSGDKSEPNWSYSDYWETYHDIWIIKIDSAGFKQWDKRFGGTEDDGLAALLQTADGGYLLGGTSDSDSTGDKTQPSWDWSSDYWIIKIDSVGNKLWDKRFGGTSLDVLSSMVQTDDGGFLLGGRSHSGISGDKTQPSWGGDDYWIVKIDSIGNMQWDKIYGGAQSEILSSFESTADGGYILGGRSSSSISGDKTQASWGLNDYWIVKIDSNANYQWDKRFGGNEFDHLSKCFQTFDHGYLLTGSSNSGNNGDKTENSPIGFMGWIVKIDSIGIMQWDKTILVEGMSGGEGAIQTADSCFVIATYTAADSGNYKTQPAWNGSSDYWMYKICESAAPPVSQFSASDSAFCPGACVSFQENTLNAVGTWQWYFEGGSPAASSAQVPPPICYDSSGLYNLTLISCNPWGCDTLISDDFITVYVPPPIPTIFQSAADTLISSPALYYQWLLNGWPIPGCIYQTLFLFWSGNFQVMVTDSNGCNSVSNTLSVILGAQSTSNNMSFKIFPNPTSSQLHFTLPTPEIIQQITITTTDGRVAKVMDGSSLPFNNEIDASRLSAGFYLVSVKAKDAVFVSRFIKL